MEIVLRAAFIYVFLWVLLRVIGKRELVQMTAFELVLLVTMGDLVQQGVTQEDFSLTGAVLAVSTLAVLVVTTSVVSVKFPRTQTWLEGHPVVIVDHGRINRAAMRRERIDLQELLEEARLKGITDLADVDYCILEAAGRFSFLTGAAKADPEPTDDDEPRAI